MGIFAKLFRREAPKPQPAESDAPAEPRHALEGPTAHWKAVKQAGEYQDALKGRAPRRVNVELMPWARGNTVSVRLSGQRVGEVWSNGPVHDALLARRAAGLPNMIIEGEVRRGDYAPFYIAIDWPEDSRAPEIAPHEAT